MPDTASSKSTTAKKQRGIGAGFVAPDGGWGWCVVLAAGCSNLSTFPVLQQFGLLFRERLTTLGLSGKEITTIINLNSCLTSFLGLLNGPMFRIFSYRQVAFFGALLAAIGVFCTSMAGSFGAYVLTFSVLYGAGTGINQSANALALNTYFKEKRRIATGISWTATALGPIIFPHIIAVLVPAYGVQNTVLMFGCLALGAVGLAMVYQPVEWHTKPAPADAELLNGNAKDELCEHCRLQRPIDGYAIVDPGTPMLCGANDGWFSTTPAKRSQYSSHVSLASGFVSTRPSYANVQLAGAQTAKPAAVAVNTSNVPEDVTPVPESRPTRTKDSKRDKLKQQTQELKIEEAEAEDCPSFKAPQDLQAKDKELQPLTTTPDDIVSNGNGLVVASITAEPTTRTKPMFTINDGFKRKPSSRAPTTAVSRMNSNQPPTSDGIDELLAGTPVGWLTVKSTVPSRNQSALSIFDMTPRRNFSTTSFHGEKEVLRKVRNRLEQFVSKEDDVGTLKCKCGRGKGLLNDDAADEAKEDMMTQMADAKADDARYTLWQRVFIFFDLDLLRDWSYVNLMVGVTMASFAELNYSILTPFVLGEYKLEKHEIATSMSVLGACDISVRFFVPFIAGYIGWENKTFFLFGVMGMALGRISIAHFHSYYAVLAASVWIGLNKGLRTVFMALVIPSYVPLERLPGATGLQLLFAGLFYFFVGPVIGWIRDTTNYTVTLHCLNIATFTTAICWGLEKWYHERRAHKKPEPQ